MAKSFSVFVNIGGRVASTFTSAISTVEGKLNGLSRRFQASALAAKAAMKQIGESMKGIAGLAAAGGLTFGIKHALGDGAELAHEIQALKNAGRTTKEVAEGIAEANKTIGKLPTTTLAENLKVLNETTGAFGDYHHALENLQFNQRIGSILQNSIGEKAGDPGEMFNSLVRAFEIRGTAADHHTYQKEVGELSRAMIFSRGNVNPAEVLNFAQQANPAIKNYSERFLTKIAPSLIQEFGGDRAGTRAGAWYNAIMGKTRDKRMADAWTKLGLLNEKDVLKNKKTGDIIGWNPGAMKGTDEALADPLAWTEKYLVPALQKAGIDTNDQMSVTKELGKLFRNSEANRFANAITQVRDRKRLHKDEGLINQVPDADKAYEDTLANDPKFAWKAIKAAFENLGSSLTVPLMAPAAKAFTAVAKAVNALAQVFTEHPNLAKAVGAVTATLAAMAAVRIAGFILGVTGLGRALVFLALSAPLGLAGRLAGVARGILAVTAAVTLGSVARMRALGVAIAAIATGSATAALATLGRGFIAVLAPMALFRTGLRLLRFALIGTGIGAAIVALGVAAEFLAKNWEGIGKGLTSFSEAFQKALPPDLAARVKPAIDALKNLFGDGDWLKFDDKQWQDWGKTFGAQLGAQVGEWTGKINNFVEALNKVKNFTLSWSDIITLDDATGSDAIGRFTTTLIDKIKAAGADFAAAAKAFAKAGYDAVTGFDWTAAGKAIVDGIVSGISAAAGTLANVLTGAVSGAWNRAKGAIGLGGGASAAPSGPAAPAVAGARARGGPVSSGLPYLVGEKGPEIFVPAGSGKIETNATLNALSRAGGKASGGLAVPVDTSAIERAGEVARRSGATIESSLDKTVKPIVDTASIDAATVKAERLKMILAGIGGDSINVGGAGGGASTGGSPAAVGRALGGGAGGSGGGAKISGPIADAPTDGVRAEVRNYLRTASAARGIDPNVAERVMRQESGFNPNARNVNAREASFGVFQLNTKGGLGNVAERQGINPRDPAQWRRHIDFGLDVVKRDGWRQWYGARDVGIKRWQGIGSGPAKPADGDRANDKAAVPLAGARALGGPVQNGLSYLVGERGPEIFTPGASGGISTNATLNRLAEVGSRTVPADEGGTSPSIAPSPATVAKLRPQGGNVTTHGDRHYSPTFHVNGAQDPQAISREVEVKFYEFIRKIEADQRGLLSD